MKPTLQGDGLCREGMNGEVVWTEEEGYVGTTGRGKRFGIYGTDTPSPMEMVLHGHAACSLIDVIDGLKHRKENVDFIKITFAKVFFLKKYLPKKSWVFDVSTRE